MKIRFENAVGNADPELRVFIDDQSITGPLGSNTQLDELIRGLNALRLETITAWAQRKPPAVATKIYEMLGEWGENAAATHTKHAYRVGIYLGSNLVAVIDD